MRTSVLIMIGLLILAPPALAENIGSSFGALTTAQVAGKGVTVLGGTVGIADYTSFVAVDASERTDGSYGVTVQQAVPVPDGVRYDTTVNE